MKRRLLTRIVLILLFGVCVYFLKKEFFDPWFPVTNPKHYSRIAAELKKKHPRASLLLPPSIPIQAREVAFFHTKGTLQGAYTVTLRLRLPNAEIQRLERDLRQSGRPAFHRGQINMSLIYPLTADERPKFGEAFTDLPKDFEVFLFDSRLEDLSNSRLIFAFTAVSTKRSEVIYFISRG